MKLFCRRRVAGMKWQVPVVAFALVFWLLAAGGLPAVAADEDDEEEPLVELPEPDETQIARARALNLTRAALPAELTGIATAVRRAVDEDAREEAQRLLEHFRGQPGALANAAAIAWVQRHPEQALLLAAEAARMAPDDANAVNTLAALLAQAGYEEKAIPLLRHLAERHPQDTSILSNLAVAWLNIGEAAEAGKIVLRVLALAPGHGVANLTAGLIAESEGRHDEAREHLRKAAASNSSPQARDILRQRGQSFRAPPGFFAMLPKKEYFSPGAFEPVRPQRNLAEYGIKLAEKKASDAALLRVITAAYKQIQEETVTMMQEAMRGEVRGGASAYAKLDWQNALKDLQLEESLALAQERLVARMLRIRELRLEYERTRTPGGAEDPTPMCERRRPIAQAALAKMTEEYEKLVGETLYIWRDVANSQIRLQRFMLPPAAYRASFHGSVAMYLELVRKLNEELPLMEDPCAGQNPGKWPGYELVPPGAGECPFSLKVDALVAEFEMDCHKFGFSFKAGLAFSATKEFASGETTLTAGLGIEADLHDIGKAEGSAQMVMVWDRANELSFVGVESSAEAKLSGIPGLGGKLVQEAVGPGGDKSPDFSKDFVKAGVKTRLGVEIGPRGLESSISGEASGQLLGQDIFRAEIP